MRNENEVMTIGLGQVPLTDEQRGALSELTASYGHRMVDLTAGGEDQIRECVAVIGEVAPGRLCTAEGLRWLQVAPAGVERFLRPGVLPHDGVVLTNGSGAYGTAISEYMLCGLLMILRRMPLYMENQRAHEWKQHPGIVTLSGSRVTVVGVGDLGTSFASRCHALGARVTGVRKSAGKRAADCYERVVTADSLDAAIADADVVALCLPATGETARLIDADRIAGMKKGAILINVGRGSAVDTAALVEALNAGQLGGALLDVTDPEPLPPDSALWDAPGAIVTPHISGLDRDRLAAGILNELFRENLKRFMAGQPLRNIVDPSRGY